MTRQCPTCGLSVTTGASCPLCGTLLARPVSLRKLLLCALVIEEAVLALLLVGG
jgi:hypothetical protein